MSSSCEKMSSKIEFQELLDASVTMLRAGSRTTNRARNLRFVIPEIPSGKFVLKRLVLEDDATRRGANQIPVLPESMIGKVTS